MLLEKISTIVKLYFRRLPPTAAAAAAALSFAEHV